MLDQLMKISDLNELLGCEDERTVHAWCKAHKVPLIKVGKIKYTHSEFVNRVLKEAFEMQLQKDHPDADRIMNAIERRDVVLFEAEPLGYKMNVPNRAQPRRSSEAANDYSNELKKLLNENT